MLYYFLLHGLTLLAGQGLVSGYKFGHNWSCLRVQAWVSGLRAPINIYLLSSRPL